VEESTVRNTSQSLPRDDNGLLTSERWHDTSLHPVYNETWIEEAKSRWRQSADVSGGDGMDSGKITIVSCGELRFTVMEFICSLLAAGHDKVPFNT